MDPNQPSCSRDSPTSSRGGDEGPPVKRRLYSEEVLRMWNLTKLVRELGTQEQGIAFAVEHGLIPESKECRVHHTPMKIDLNANQTVGMFYCGRGNCRGKTRKSQTTGTWFENIKIQLLHVYYLMYCFAHRRTHDDVIHEDPLRDEIGQCLSRVTITDWYSYCREAVVIYQLEQEQQKGKIGGPGKIVQIDESKFGKRKYNKGRRVEGHWVLGLIEDGSEDLRLEVCPDNIRSADVLIAIIQKHVEEGTIIHTDHWRAYDCLDQYGYIHKKSKLFVLYEHSAGFVLFRVTEFEELAAFLPQVEESVTDLQRFNSVVTLIAFQPFKSAVLALENINAISEGILPEDLNLFLEGALPKRKKRNKCTLGVSDPKLGAAISEALEVPCSHTGAVPEVLRGIRHHFHSLIKGLTLKACSVAQLGLGHSYSRARVKFNVHRVDNMIIQSIALLDQLDKDINTFSMRIREWYSYHFPELVSIVPDNHLYAKCAEHIKDRKSLTEESLEPLTEILGDSEKAQAILDASKMSMGMDISPVDLINIQMFAVRVVALVNYRKQISEYLHTKMNSVAPNLTTLVGDQVGARLISKAGSLTSLAKYPASTLQILGAEKALFRALKTRSKTPKYGLLYHSTFIGRAGVKNKGRISRYLANKCSIASRIDCFSENQTTIYGEKLRQQVEDRLKFYETGDIPAKNIDVMKQAMEEVALMQEQTAAPEAPKKKKKKKKDKQNKQEVEVMEE